MSCGGSYLPDVEPERPVPLNAIAIPARSTRCSVGEEIPFTVPTTAALPRQPAAPS
jgi:hypothetical protein